MHDDELPLSDETARTLVFSRFPAFADRELVRLPDAGTVNVLFRLGDDLTVRFPRRAADPQTERARLEREHRRAAEFADVSPVPAPVPIGLGRPGHGYPLPWSVQTWVVGEVATPTSCASSTALAEDLAVLITTLRAAPTRGRSFTGNGRGGDLRAHDPWVERCLAASHHLVDVEAASALWTTLRETPRREPDVMTHGDLTPGNLLVGDGELAGVLDAGGFGPADPALDLVAAWHLLDGDARAALRDRLACDDDEWDRGRAWAFEQALGAAWYYEHTNPSMHTLGMTTLRRLLGAA